MRRRVSVALSVVVWAGLTTGGLVIGAQPVAAASPTVTGAGSTWSQIAVDQWRADVARRGLRINYQGTGSTAGRQFYVIGDSDFAVSEIPFEPEEISRMSGKRPFVYLPIVAGGTSLMYNLRDDAGKAVRDLRLSPRTVAAIFTGNIRDWSDQTITADNAGRRLPAGPITPVIRSDGSGTSAQFTAFLAKTTPDLWGPFARSKGRDAGPTSFYPEFPEKGSKAQSGSDGVANYVNSETSGKGSITYVETGYALQRGRPVASLLNASGRYTQPTAQNVAIALARARLNADRTQVLDDVYTHRDPNAYAMSSYSYMIAPTEGFDPAKGEVLAKFIHYFVCTGQEKAEVLGYSPLPRNLVETALEAAAAIPGAPPAPAITPAECTNPTVTGKFKTTSAGPAPAPQASPTASGARPGPVAGSVAGSATGRVSAGPASGGPTGTATAPAGTAGPLTTVSANGSVSPAVVADGAVTSIRGSTEPLAIVRLSFDDPPSPAFAASAATLLIVVFGPALAMHRRRPLRSGRPPTAV